MSLGEQPAAVPGASAMRGLPKAAMATDPAPAFAGRRRLACRHVAMGTVQTSSKGNASLIMISVHPQTVGQSAAVRLAPCSWRQRGCATWS